jgi:GAF domain-containing protein
MHYTRYHAFCKIHFVKFRIEYVVTLLVNLTDVFLPKVKNLSKIKMSNNRSVNDFDTTQGLRAALKCPLQESSFDDIGRDFPRALIGSSLGLPRDDESQSECSTVFHADTDLDWMLRNHDEENSNAQTLDEELRRLEALKSYMILDSVRESRFERITGLASRVLRVPIALVSLVDLGRQWFMSNRGLGDCRETPRRIAFCAHAIISKDDLLIVPDATKDPRFKDSPLVLGPPFIRFYGGAPLLSPEGFRLGTLCVIDTVVRPEGLSLEERQTLRELAALVMDAMVERRREKLSILQDNAKIIATTAHDLLTPLSGVQLSLTMLMDDENFKQNSNGNQQELISMASACADIMNRVCCEAIDAFRNDLMKQNERFDIRSNKAGGLKAIKVEDFVNNLKVVLESFPRFVPFYISVDNLVPSEICVADDLKVFRSAMNFLTNALQKTVRGSVRKCNILLHHHFLIFLTFLHIPYTILRRSKNFCRRKEEKTCSRIPMRRYRPRYSGRKLSISVPPISRAIRH